MRSNHRQQDHTEQYQQRVNLDSPQARPALPQGLEDRAVAMGTPGTRLLGQALDAGHAVARVGLRMALQKQDEERAVKATEIINDYHSALNRFSAEYRRTKQGSLAKDAGPEFAAFAREEMQKRLNGIEDGKTRFMVFKGTNGLAIHFEERGLAYGVRQTEAHKRNQFAGDLMRIKQLVAENPGNWDLALHAWGDFAERFTEAHPGQDVSAPLMQAKQGISCEFAEGLIAARRLGEARNFVRVKAGDLGDKANNLLMRIEAAEARTKLERVFPALSALPPEEAARSLNTPEGRQKFGLSADQAEIALGMYKAQRGQAARREQERREAYETGILGRIVNLALGIGDRGEKMEPDPAAAYQTLAVSDLDEKAQAAVSGALENGTLGRDDPAFVLDARKRIARGEALTDLELVRAVAEGRLGIKTRTELKALREEAAGPRGSLMKHAFTALDTAFQSSGLAEGTPEHTAAQLAAQSEVLHALEEAKTRGNARELLDPQSPRYILPGIVERHQLGLPEQIGAVKKQLHTEIRAAATPAMPDEAPEHGDDPVEMRPLPPSRLLREAMEQRDSFFAYGLQSSIYGLVERGKLPDAVSKEALEKAGWQDRLALNLGILLGDIPALALGGALGAAGGPAAPVTVPAGAMALTSGLRASLTDKIEQGRVDDFFYCGGLGNALKEAAKGGAIGAAVGAAGHYAGMGARMLGVSGIGSTGVSLAAETAAMPMTGAALEGRLPHEQDFLDAAVLIGGLGIARGSARAVRAMPDLVPKLRDIYAQTGKTPLEVSEAARKDPTVREDLLSDDKGIPGAFAEEMLNRLKAGEKVPTEKLHGYLPRNWAKAELLEQQGPEAVREGIKGVVENTLQGKPTERLHWKVLRQDEAAKLSQDTGLDIPAGLVHSIDPIEVRHAFNHHGNPAVEAARGQVALISADYALIPEVTAIYDNVTPIVTDKGLPGLQYRKRIGNTFYVVEEIRSGRNELSFTTMWKMDDAKIGVPPALTPEATVVGPTAADGGHLFSRQQPTTPIAEVKSGGVFSGLKKLLPNPGEKPQDFLIRMMRQTK